MIAEIITIGDEILIGQIVDTNSAWISQRLNEVGIRIKQITSISDDKEHILDSLESAASRAQLIILTGGLGPTKDDITKNTLAEYFGVGMRRDLDALENVKQIFARYNGLLLDVNLRQADVLENCITILNKNGTAPGMWIENNSKIYISMPGVPFEMMFMMEDFVIPKLSSSINLPNIIHHTILTSGIGESFLADTISKVEDALPPHIKLAYLPKLGQVRLRLSAYGNDRSLLENEVENYAAQIVSLIKPNVIAEVDKPIEKIILDFMDSRELTLAIAESCTGGYISHIFTQHPGSSNVFLGGAVTYSNQLKQTILDVSEQTLDQFGAVSEETVTEMVLGSLKKFKSDYAVAVSGIAGPDGGTPEKPVGTIWIAVANKTKTVTKKFTFNNRRIQNIERSAISGLTMLFNLLNEDFS